MSKDGKNTPEPLTIIKSRHYQQARVRAERREQRIERRRRGEAALPKRRWKKGHGNTSGCYWPNVWTPFNPDGTLRDQGFTIMGSISE